MLMRAGFFARSWIEAKSRYVACWVKTHVTCSRQQKFATNFRRPTLMRNFDTSANSKISSRWHARAVCISDFVRERAEIRRQETEVAKGRGLFGERPPLLVRTCVCSESGPTAKAANTPPGKAALFSTRLCVYLKITHAHRSKVFALFILYIYVWVGRRVAKVI